MPPRELVVPAGGGGHAARRVARAGARRRLARRGGGADRRRRRAGRRRARGRRAPACRAASSVRVERRRADAGRRAAGRARDRVGGRRLLVVDKPPGIVVHPAPGHRGVTLVEWLGRALPGLGAARRPPPRPRHLGADAGRQGRGGAAASCRRRCAGARCCASTWRSSTGRLGVAHRHDRRADRPRRAPPHAHVDPHGHARARRAPTSRSSGSPGDHTLVRARLETGRTHQIRAHFAAIGHPLAGDRDYGARDDLGLERQFLHSARLALPSARVALRAATGPRRRTGRAAPEPGVDAAVRTPGGIAATQDGAALGRAEAGPSPRPDCRPAP